MVLDFKVKKLFIFPHSDLQLFIVCVMLPVVKKYLLILSGPFQCTYDVCELEAPILLTLTPVIHRPTYTSRFNHRSSQISNDEWITGRPTSVCTEDRPSACGDIGVISLCTWRHIRPIRPDYHTRPCVYDTMRGSSVRGRQRWGSLMSCNESGVTFVRVLLMFFWRRNLNFYP